MRARAARWLAMLAATMVGAASVFAQTSAAPTGPVTEEGARLCKSSRMIHETEAQYQARLRVESDTPDWIWDVVARMEGQAGPMKFSFVRVGNARVLLASGTIDEGAAGRLETALARNYPVHEVWFNSPGGDSRVGVEMGDILRRNRLLTRVRAGDGCASACSTAFLGGVMREVEPGALYGVHMFSTLYKGAGVLNEDTFNAVQWSGAQGAAERIAYVERMGVDIKWLQLWSDTAPGCMTFMSRQELRDSLVNNLQ